MNTEHTTHHEEEAALVAMSIEELKRTKKIAEDLLEKRMAAAVELTIEPARFEPQRNKPGVMKMIPVELLVVDERYQRELQADSALSIAKNWNWASLKVISVSYRNGRYFVYDGQHEVAAAKLRGDILELPCYVVDLDDSSEEAFSFVEMQQKRRRLKPMEVYKASVISKDPGLALLVSILEEYRVEFSGTAGVRKCSAVSTLQKRMEKGAHVKGEAAVRWTMKILDAAWGEDERGFSGRIVQGMLRVYSRLCPLEREAWTRLAGSRLKSVGIATVLNRAEREADKQDCTVLNVLPKAIIAAYEGKIHRRVF